MYKLYLIEPIDRYSYVLYILTRKYLFIYVYEYMRVPHPTTVTAHRTLKKRLFFTITRANNYVMLYRRKMHITLVR